MPIRGCSVARRAMFGVAALMLGAASAHATPYLVVDADSGQVLMQNEATAALVSRLAHQADDGLCRIGRGARGKLTLDTPLVMSVRAARMPPSKMGFRPGTEVTLDNALKMLMVKSPNDVAVMVAEGVSGSVEAFADDMNADAQRLGLHESHFVNPNGLHDPGHVSSARDMAMIARALLREFPNHADLFDIGAIQFGKQYIPNHNGLLGRYPGADGMKTGFTCPAGFNIVASANHSGRRLIVVVLGAPTARSRNQEAANLFDRGFGMGGGARRWNRLPNGSGPAPNMRADVCLHRNAALIAATEEEGSPSAPSALAGAGDPDPFGGVLRLSHAGPAHRALGRTDPFRSGSRVSSGPSRAGRVRCWAPAPPRTKRARKLFLLKRRLRTRMRRRGMERSRPAFV